MWALPRPLTLGASFVALQQVAAMHEGIGHLQANSAHTNPQDPSSLSCFAHEFGGVCSWSVQVAKFRNEADWINMSNVLLTWISLRLQNSFVK